MQAGDRQCKERWAGRSEAGQVWVNLNKTWNAAQERGRPSLSVCAWMITIIDGLLSSGSSYTADLKIGREW